MTADKYLKSDFSYKTDDKSISDDKFDDSQI